MRETQGELGKWQGRDESTEGMKVKMGLLGWGTKE